MMAVQGLEISEQDIVNKRVYFFKSKNTVINTVIFYPLSSLCFPHYLSEQPHKSLYPDVLQDSDDRRISLVW
jgi:hypothetical protein